ncbi:MAG: HD domain-containing protein [Bacteroidota bacterium]
MEITLTQVSLLIFLLANLIVALYSTRRIATMKEYVKANKELGRGALIATLAATLLDADNIGLRVGYEIGLLSMRNPILLALAALLLGRHIFPKITQFTNEYTIAELMNTFFGSFARYFTVAVSSFFCLLVLVTQLVAWGNISSIIGMSPTVAIILMGLFVTLYTLFGGVRAVARTDILQMIVILVCSIFFFLIIFYQNGGIRSILSAVPNNTKYDSLLTYPNIGGWLWSAFFYSFFPTLIISPPIVQRLLMTKKKRDVASMFTYFAFFYILFRFLMLIVSLSRFSTPASPDSIRHTPIGEVVRLLCASPICQLLFLLIVCAIIMSTMDSFLNSLSIMLVNDTIKPNSEADNKQQVVYIKLISFFVGLLTVTIALTYKKIYFLSLFRYGAIALSSIAIPFLFTLGGLKGSKKSFLAHIITFWLSILIPFFLVKIGNITFFNLVAIIANYTIHSSVFDVYTNTIILKALWYIAIITSTIAFLTTHYLEHGGFLIVKRVRNIWVPVRLLTIKPFFRWLLHPVRWANEKVAKVGDRSFFFSFFVICYYMVPYWAEPSATSLNYWGLYLLRVFAVIIACGGFVGKKMWANPLQPFFNFYYQWSIFLCITCVTTITTISDLNNPVTPFYILVGVVAAGFFVDWGSFWLFQSLALFISLSLHKAITGRWMILIQNDYVLPVLGSIAFSLTMVYLIKHLRDDTSDARKLAKKLEEEKQNILVSITDSADQLSQVIGKDSIMMKEMQKNLDVLKLKLGDAEEVKAINNAMQYFYEKSEDSKRHLRMAVREIKLNDLFDDAWYDLDAKGLNPSENYVQIEHNNHSDSIFGDLYYLKSLLVHGTAYGMDSSENKRARLVVDDVYIQYELPKIYKNDPKKAIRIIITNDPDISLEKEVYTPYESDTAREKLVPKELKNNIRIVKAHFGFLNFNKSRSYTTQTYVLPLNLKTIRPKIEYFAYDDLFDEVRIDSPQDQMFLAKVAKKGMQAEKIQLAMQVAKHYHFNQFRNSGEPYYLHPLAVATILLECTDDEAVIAAALLHDTIEDTPYEVSQMKTMFGDRVSRIVQEVSHLYSKDERPKIKLEKKETLDELIKHGNLDSLLVKLADRLHNMRTIHGKRDPKKRKKVAEETIKVFLPIARRLGYDDIEKELKELCEKIS